MPAGLKPMLATLIEKPFDHPAWNFEIKHDGYRAIAYLNNGRVELSSRNNQSFNKKFFPVYDALKKWKIVAVIDGEIVVLNKKGMSVFNALQNWRSERDGPLSYYVFDLLWFDGKNLMNMPLYKRRKKLKAIMPDSDVILFSDSIASQGVDFFNLAEQAGLEGIMAKKRESLYFPGRRTKNWLKIKVAKEKDLLICGFTKNEASGKPFSSLILGGYKDKQLTFAGQVGTGFTDQQQRDILQKLKPLIRKKSPFTIIPDLRKGGRWRRQKPEIIAWCKPALVCRIRFLEITPSGELRHQSFAGLRPAKRAGEVTIE